MISTQRANHWQTACGNILWWYNSNGSREHQHKHALTQAQTSSEFVSCALQILKCGQTGIKFISSIHFVSSIHASNLVHCLHQSMAVLKGGSMQICIEFGSKRHNICFVHISESDPVQPRAYSFAAQSLTRGSTAQYRSHGSSNWMALPSLTMNDFSIVGVNGALELGGNALNDIDKNLN